MAVTIELGWADQRHRAAGLVCFATCQLRNAK